MILIKLICRRKAGYVGSYPVIMDVIVIVSKEIELIERLVVN